MGILPADLVASVNALLGTRGRSPVGMEEILFASDQDVTWGRGTFIPRECLVPPHLATQWFAGLTKGGPSWIHGNLVKTSEGTPLLLVHVGERVGNSMPAVNVSFEDTVLRIAEEPESGS